MSSLCESCADLGLTAHDFTDFKIGANGTNNNVIKRQFLGVLKNTITCSLCQLIALAVEDTRREWEKEPISDDAVQCFVRLIPNWFPTPNPFKVLDIGTQFPFHGPSYGIQLLPVGPGNSQGPLIGRPLSPTKVSLTLIKDWMLKCIQSHGESCGQSKSPRFNEIKEMLLVIDVEQGCIVQPADQVQYLALSYVWGKTKSVLLLKENIADLQQPGGIAKVFKNLPCTIRDAIKLTRDLEEKYLWIDSLCIIQNDADFKSKITHKMNLVYENAFLTIIAASGSDANAGLPGVCESRRNFIQPLADVHGELKLIYASLHQSLAKSTWATRGWTYQEYYFSKRRLIFHNGLAFFHCRKRSWREDIALEDFDEDVRQYDLKQGFHAASEFWESREGDSHFWDTHWSFWSSVRAYKNRELTYDNDMLNAFAGIIDHFQVGKDIETFWGLPLSTFVSDLFWQPDIFGVWRDGFPTWSWAGWTGGLASSKLGSEEHRLLSSWISVFRLESVETGSIRFAPVHVSKDRRDEDAFRGSQEECLKSVLQLLTELVLASQQIREGTIKAESYCEIPHVQESISTLAKLAHTRFDLTQTLAAYTLDLGLKSQAIYFRALTARVWISACAPNGEVLLAKKRLARFPDAQSRPTLYMYSTREPTLKPVGHTWIQNPVTYLKTVERTNQAAPKEIQKEMKPGATGPLIFTVDPKVWFFQKEGENGNSQDQKPLSDEQQMTAIKIKQQLQAFSKEQQYPYDDISTLPDNPQELEEILRSRRILNLRIALISGPVHGDGKSRMGVPFGYPSDGRRFFRALVLWDKSFTRPDYPENIISFSQMIGICELEIDALPLLENVQLEDVVLL